MNTYGENIDAFRDMSTILFGENIKRQIIKSCLNCINFNEEDETCLLAKARPPARIIVFGCPQWDADIPF
jgi:hypothetical protein